jgi:hypothetical protein
MGEAGLDQQPRTSMTRPRSPRPGDGARATSLSVHRSEAVDAQRRLRHQVPWHPVLSRRAQKARRCCPSHSPTLRPWIARSAVCATGSGRPSWRRSGARRSPTFRKSAGKSRRYFNSVIYCAETREGLSLSSGASSRPGVSQAAHHLSLCSRLRGFASEMTKATLSGRPRAKLVCG